jgi:hypothetical protein
MQPIISMAGPEVALELSLKVESIFNEVLSEGGAKALFYYLRSTRGISAADIATRPADFQEALSSILGNYGASLLIDRVRKAAETS